MEDVKASPWSGVYLPRGVGKVRVRFRLRARTVALKGHGPVNFPYIPTDSRVDEITHFNDHRARTPSEAAQDFRTV